LAQVLSFLPRFRRYPTRRGAVFPLFYNGVPSPVSLAIVLFREWRTMPIFFLLGQHIWGHFLSHCAGVGTPPFSLISALRLLPQFQGIFPSPSPQLMRSGSFFFFQLQSSRSVFKVNAECCRSPFFFSPPSPPTFFPGRRVLPVSESFLFFLTVIPGGSYRVFSSAPFWWAARTRAYGPFKR